MSKLLSALRFAFGFLTRLPVGNDSMPITAETFARAVVCFPIVGAVLGGIMWAWQALVLPFAGPQLTSVSVIAIAALLTGGLHLDGLADLFDGLGGYRGNRERMLEIMRDSRIGSHGAVALVLCLMARLSVTSELLAHGLSWALIGATTCARFCVLPLLALFPYARADGLGVDLQRHTGLQHVLIALVFTLAVEYALSWQLVLPTAYAVFAALALGFWIWKRLGGLTGDVYGAAIELAELAFLIACQLSLEQHV